jgi:hydroxyacylglutathione hydrolase
MIFPSIRKRQKMKIEQIYTGCLAQGAYYIESQGEAAIIDPLRETAPYLEMAEKNKVKIKYIFETHFHADFVSGHLDLAKETGAQIVFGPNAETAYDKHLAKDGEEFKLGALTIRVLHTPGHTPESTTYLLLDESGKPHAIFSGDTPVVYRRCWPPRFSAEKRQPYQRRPGRLALRQPAQ